jgi:hypothetical protein
MPAAVGVGDNCTRGALIAAIADAWVRDFIVTFSCPGYTIANNSLPREGCAYTHSGMFISLQARRFLFDGYVDPFASYLTQRDVERTEPTMRYQCRNAKRFLFRTMSFAATQAGQAAGGGARNGQRYRAAKTKGRNGGRGSISWQGCNVDVDGRRARGLVVRQRRPLSPDFRPRLQRRWV